MSSKKLDAAIDALVDVLAELPEHELEGWQRGNRLGLRILCELGRRYPGIVQPRGAGSAQVCLSVRARCDSLLDHLEGGDVPVLCWRLLGLPESRETPKVTCSLSEDLTPRKTPQRARQRVGLTPRRAVLSRHVPLVMSRRSLPVRKR